MFHCIDEAMTPKQMLWNDLSPDHQIRAKLNCFRNFTNHYIQDYLQLLDNWPLAFTIIFIATKDIIYMKLATH